MNVRVGVRGEEKGLILVPSDLSWRFGEKEGGRFRGTLLRVETWRFLFHTTGQGVEQMQEWVSWWVSRWFLGVAGRAWMSRR